MEYNEIKQINVTEKYITIALKKVSLELVKQIRDPIILKEICYLLYF